MADETVQHGASVTWLPTAAKEPPPRKKKHANYPKGVVPIWRLEQARKKRLAAAETCTHASESLTAHESAKEFAWAFGALVNMGEVRNFTVVYERDGELHLGVVGEHQADLGAAGRALIWGSYTLHCKKNPL